MANAVGGVVWRGKVAKVAMAGVVERVVLVVARMLSRQGRQAGGR